MEARHCLPFFSRFYCWDSHSDDPILGILMGIIGLIIFVGVDALEFHPMATSAVMGAMMYASQWFIS